MNWVFGNFSNTKSEGHFFKSKGTNPSLVFLKIFTSQKFLKIAQNFSRTLSDREEFNFYKLFQVRNPESETWGEIFGEV